MQPNQILAARVITASGVSQGFSVPNDSVSIQLEVTAVTGTTPSAVFSVAWSDDGVTYSPASPADVFTAITAPGSVVERFTAKAAFYQLVWTVTGTTPSFTVTAYAAV